MYDVRSEQRQKKTKTENTETKNKEHREHLKQRQEHQQQQKKERQENEKVPFTTTEKEKWNRHPLLPAHSQAIKYLFSRETSGEYPGVVCAGPSLLAL